MAYEKGKYSDKPQADVKLWATEFPKDGSIKDVQIDIKAQKPVCYLYLGKSDSFYGRMVLVEPDGKERHFKVLGFKNKYAGAPPAEDPTPSF
jgi:hypothetical protein